MEGKCGMFFLCRGIISFCVASLEVCLRRCSVQSAGRISPFFMLSGVNLLMLMLGLKVLSLDVVSYHIIMRSCYWKDI